MIVASAILVPELQHFFREFVIGSAVNKYKIPAPVDIPLLQLEPKNRGSFVELLFNDDYTYNYYRYLYKPNPSWGCIPQVALNRLQIYPGAGKYMKLDATDGTNTFCLKQHDLTMLNALLTYRQDSTAVTIVDATNVLTFDSSTNILTVDYNFLNTNLSKLIYLFLDLKIRNNIDKYNNVTLVCDTVLEACYEAYVLDQYFKFVSARGT
jgi:hypothetical protein